MNNGPRIYNSESPQAREARLMKKQARREKQIHKNRRTIILTCFAVVFLLLGVQIMGKVSQTHQINQRVQASKENLVKVQHKESKLRAQRNNLQDPDYVAKFIRNKFFYSKSDEKVYNLPNGDN